MSPRPRRVGDIMDYVEPGDRTLGLAYQRFAAAAQSAIDAMTPAERAADERRLERELDRASRGAR